MQNLFADILGINPKQKRNHEIVIIIKNSLNNALT